MTGTASWNTWFWQTLMELGNNFMNEEQLKMLINDVMRQVKAGVDEARKSGVQCGYPSSVEFDVDLDNQRGKAKFSVPVKRVGYTAKM